MIDSNTPTDAVVAEYLAGTLPQEERRVVENWVSANPKNAAELESYRKVWGVAKRRYVSVDVDAAWSTLVETPDLRMSKTHRRGPWLYRTLTMAAVLVIGVIGIKYIPTITNIKQSTSQSKTYTTQPGQRATITLPDGSQVMLSVASRLSVPQNFGKQSRTIDLIGEAHFTVKSRSDAPFIVRTGQHSAQVLGTSFVVRHYSNESQARVIVSEGRVGVAGQVLSAGQGIAVTNIGNISMLTDAQVTAGLAWTGGRLVFHDTPVSEALAQIGRWYDVEFVIDDPALAQSTITATLQSNTLTSALLADLSASLDAELVRDGWKITVNRRK